jgi:hypothetical protein
MVFSHRRPLQVERLIDRILELSPQAQVVLHHDEHLVPMTWTRPPGPRVHVIDHPTHIHWGGISQLRARLRVLRHIHEHIPFDWTVTISGQDYPVRHLSAWEAEVAGGGHDFILGARPVPFGPGPRRRVLAEDESYLRYAYRWTPLHPVEKYAVPVANRVARLFGADPVMVTRPFRESAVLGVIRRPIFDEHWHCYKGPTEMALSAAAVTRVVDVLTARPEIERYYATTLFPAESCLHTVLFNQPDLRALHQPVSYKLWEGGQAAHPQMIDGIDGVERAVASGSAFARKFDIDTDEAVFDAADKATDMSRK